MTRLAFSLLALTFAASAVANPCSHRLEAPADAAAWASGTLAVADFDGDRVTDVVLRDDAAPVIRLLRRDGSTIDFRLDIGGDVRGVAIGDFDGDGRPDIAMTSFEFNGYLAMNRLPAGFEVEPFPQADGFAQPLAADFDRDGNVDLMMVGGGQPRLLYGDGGGRFPESLATGIVGSVPAAVVDWNGDGFMDLLLARSSNRFAVHVNENGSAFRAGGTVEVDGYTNEIVVGDVTGDGHPDLVALTSTTIAIADGNGGDGFAEPRAKTMAQAAAEGAVIADFDGDGRNELAFSLANRSEFIGGVMVNMGPELVVSRVSAGAGRNDLWAFPTRRSVPLFSGDFDGNGRLDLMAGGAIYRGSGALGFATEERVSPGFSPSMVAAGDFNGDGFADLAVASSDSGIRLYRGGATGGLAAATTLDVDHPRSLLVTDFDQDGRADLVIGRSGEIVVYYGTGSGEAILSSPVSITVSGMPLAVTALDMTGNGRSDLVFSEGSGEGYILKILASDVPRGFFPFQTFDAGTMAPTAMALADVDLNTVADLVVVSAGKTPTTPPFEHDGKIVAFRRDGTGRIVTQDLLADKLSPAGIETADWDLDGDTDLLIAQRYGPLLLLRNEGAMEFSAQALGAGSTLQMLRTDLDRDGQWDVLLLQTAENVLRLEHQGGELREAGGFVVGSVPVAMTIGDFNGDGVIDIAVANAGSDSVSVVYGSCGRTRAVRRR